MSYEMGEWYIPASGPVHCIEGFPGFAFLEV